jgi:hypothetical protein
VSNFFQAPAGHPVKAENKMKTVEIQSMQTNAKAIIQSVARRCALNFLYISTPSLCLYGKSAKMNRVQ